MEENKKKTFIIHLPQESHYALKAFAALKNVTMNSYILEAIHKQLLEDQSRQ